MRWPRRYWWRSAPISFAPRWAGWWPKQPALAAWYATWPTPVILTGSPGCGLVRRGSSRVVGGKQPHPASCRRDPRDQGWTAGRRHRRGCPGVAGRRTRHAGIGARGRRGVLSASAHHGRPRPGRADHAAGDTGQRWAAHTRGTHRPIPPCFAVRSATCWWTICANASHRWTTPAWKASRAHRHPAVGDQRDAVPAVLQHAQQRRELVQLGHPVGTRTLVSDDDDDVAVQFAAGERLHDLRLVIEHPSRRGDHPMRRRDRRHLDHRAAEVAPQDAQPAVGGEGVADRAQHLPVEAFGRSGSPNQ